MIHEGYEAARQRVVELLDEKIEAAKEIEYLRQQLETERMRLAACGTAALGYFDGCKDEYKSASLDDVLRLRQQLAECERERDELKTWLEDQVCEAKDFAYKLEGKTVELAAVTKERDKLVSALEGIASGEDSDGCITSIKYCIRTAQKALAKLGADKMGEK